MPVTPKEYGANGLGRVVARVAESTGVSPKCDRQRLFVFAGERTGDHSFVLLCRYSQVSDFVTLAIRQDGPFASVTELPRNPFNLVATWRSLDIEVISLFWIVDMMQGNDSLQEVAVLISTMHCFGFGEDSFHSHVELRCAGNPPPPNEQRDSLMALACSFGLAELSVATPHPFDRSLASLSKYHPLPTDTTITIPRNTTAQEDTTIPGGTKEQSYTVAPGGSGKVYVYAPGDSIGVDGPCMLKSGGYLLSDGFATLLQNGKVIVLSMLDETKLPVGTTIMLPPGTALEEHSVTYDPLLNDSTTSIFLSTPQA
jgi:hypothetical protein